MPFQVLNIAVRAAVAGAITFSALSDFSAVSVGVLALAVAAFAAWLWFSRGAQQAQAEVRRQRGLEYIRNSSSPWKKQPNPTAAGLLMLAVGAVLLYGAFDLRAGDNSMFTIRQLHALVGDRGAVAASAVLAVLFLSSGIEVLLFKPAKTEA